MSLMGWVIVWAVVTTAVVVLAYFRLTMGLHEVLGVRFGSGHQAEFYGEQRAQSRKMKRLDAAGMILTAASVLMVFVIVVLWAIESAGGA